MAAPLPQTELQTFVTSLSEILLSHVKDLEVIRSAIVRTNRLLDLGKVDACDAYQVLAMAHFADGNRIECFKCLENALESGSVSATGLSNFVVYYSNFGEIQKCLTLAREVVSRFPDDKDALKNSLTFISMYRDINVATRVLAQLDKLSINDEPSESLELKRNATEKSGIAMQKFHMSDVQIQERLKFAIDTLRARHIEVQRINANTLRDGTFMYHLYLDEQLDECSELNFVVAESLCEKFSEPGGDLFNIVCRPFSTFADKKGEA